MANCGKCGKQIKAGVKFCTSCGAAVSGTPVKTEAHHSTANQTNVISTLGWIGYLLVMIVPIVGLVLYIVWAFGTGGNPNVRNHSRAVLILMAVSIGFSIIFGLLFSTVLASVLSW